MDMISAAALILACCAQQGEDGVSLGLRYLARHQAADGSWGRRLRDCGCPAEPLPPAAAADEATRARVSALIQDLDHDDFDRRAQAQ
ncbi:MAG: hypothetical protein HY293_07265, partial [Planctomycetes bacterium]|nr:hypothetical protein [Planctomycetota bacterium]